MNYINNLLTQVKDLFSGMTPGSRIVSGLLLTVILAALAILASGIGGFSTGTSTAEVMLYDGYSFIGAEQRAAETAFAAKGLKNYDFKSGRLYVPSRRKFDYIACLAEAGVIKESDVEINALISSITPIDSTLTTNSKIFFRAQQRLGDTFKRFTGIEDAKVESFERIDRLPGRFDKTKIRTAAVTIWPTSTEPIPDKTISAITALVKRGLGITDVKDITIINGHTGEGSAGTEDDLRGGRKTLAGEIRNYTEQWEEKIQKSIGHIPGVRVQVGVDVEPVEQSTSLLVEHKPPSSAVHERVQTSNFERTDEKRSGRPGYVAQANTPLNLDQARGITSTGKQKEETSNEERTNALQGVERNVVDAPFSLKSVTASISVPQSYFRTVWLLRQQNSPQQPAAATAGGAGTTGGGTDTPVSNEPTAAQLELIKSEVINNIKLSVANLLKSCRKADDLDPTQGVEVVPYDDIPHERPGLPSLTEEITMFLVENWETIALLSLVFCGLAVLWTVSQPPKQRNVVIYEAPEIPQEQLEARYAPTKAEEEEELERQRSLNPFDKSLVSLQEEVADMVSEDPEAAAAVIKQWIGIGTAVPAEK
ncbi:MAG: hypothetical protein LBU65_02955 [Planctomycetaceae bacterium]|jgi:flagellar biosynthesis/type III secretory pathway M-ring protein FliF/YscJ|nr:hypothetical protein [Planctomycetaceae bacterium]